MRYSRGEKILFFILIIPVIIALVTTVVMLLWNWLVPDMFNGPVISFWQALGLLILSKILFGGFRKKGHHHGGGHWGGHWKRKFKEMTPEEREAFRQKWSSKWGQGWCEPRGAVQKDEVKNNPKSPE